MSSGDLPEVVIEKGRGSFLVWLLPIVALLVGGYLGYDAWVNRGIDIVITYPTAEWIQAGKTKVKFRSVEIGTVKSVDFMEGGKGVELHCTLDAKSAPYLTEDAEFWIEHPRVGGGEISGLGTLLSGAYLATNLGDQAKPRKRRFAGLAEPPIDPLSDGGLRLLLESRQLYSLQPGTLVLFRGESVGKVERVKLAEDGSGFEIQIYIEKEHVGLVRRDSRFWNAGGIQISAKLGEFNVATPSLASLVTGGVAFDAPRGERSPAAESGARFRLHESRSELETYAYSHDGLQVFVEAKQLQGVAEGDTVSYRELAVGSVVALHLATDSRRLRVELNIMDRYASLVRHNTVFWNASGISANLGLSGLHIHAESLQDLLSGGVAFATPDPPGDRVKPGSVFRLHSEVKDEWMKWEPVLWRGAPGDSPAAKAQAAKKATKSEEKTEAERAGGEPDEAGKKHEGFFSRFFHHEGKSEEEAKKDHAG